MKSPGEFCFMQPFLRKTSDCLDRHMPAKASFPRRWGIFGDFSFDKFISRCLVGAPCRLLVIKQIVRFMQALHKKSGAIRI